MSANPFINRHLKAENPWKSKDGTALESNGSFLGGGRLAGHTRSEKRSFLKKIFCYGITEI